MNILILHSHVPFFHGGAEVLVEGLHQAFRERGHRVDVVSIPYTWNPAEKLLSSALTWRMIDVTQSNGVLVDLVICTKYPTWAVRHPRKVLWLVHQHRQAYDLFGTPYSELGGDEYSKSIRRRVVEIDRRGMLECERRFAISRNVARRLSKFTGLDAETLYPPIPRSGLMAEAYEPFVLSAARLDSLKRIDALIDAWPRVDPSLRLVIASDGPDRESLERRVKSLRLSERVSFLGRMPDEELTRLYNRCRAVYYAPVDEDYGYSAVEALAAGKAVITAPDSGGVLEFVEHGRTGLVAELAPEALADAINQLADERLARELGSAGARSLPELDWDHVVASLSGNRGPIMPEPAAIQFVSPLPPLRTGIAQYSRDLLNAIDGRWPLRVFPEDGSRVVENFRAQVIDPRHFDPESPTIIQLGNSEFHRRAFEIGLEVAGVAVFHDVVLHHGLLAVALSNRKMPEYWRGVWSRYGTEGYQAGKALLRGAPVDAINFPLSERYIERAALTVVHNRFAERVVQAIVPGARVMLVPMGIPIPAEIPKSDARRALGWPDSAFVVASISHINPNKRLPVVLRAIKRLAARLPETLFVIAGSRSPAVDVERQIRALGLGDRVIVTGYVDDQRARTIAAAADACVNLRFPPAGETSASLLRLLGAGKPVLVTDGVPSEDLPPDVGLRVPVDRLEEEFIEEMLYELATKDLLREQAGAVARAFVRDCHSMGVALEGYRRAIEAAFGIELPQLGELVSEEPAPNLDCRDGDAEYVLPSFFDRSVTAAIAELGLARRDRLLDEVSARMVELGLNLLPGTESEDISDPGKFGKAPSERLARRVICPRCRGELLAGQGGYTCSRCGETWVETQGIPDFGRLAQ